MYYNPQTKEQCGLEDLKNRLNASIPWDTEEVAGWYLIHDAEYPECDATHKAVLGGIVLQPDGTYARVYDIVEKTKEDLLADAEMALQQAKEERSQAVSHITVEVDGMVFDGDETAQDRMSRVAAIAGSEELDTQLPWVLADNTVATVTVAQIKEALRKALYAQAELWVKPYTSD